MTRLIARRRSATRPARQPPGGHAAALEQLWRLAYREASTLAFADAFRAIMLAFVVATLLVPLLRNVAAPKGPAQARTEAGHARASNGKISRARHVAETGLGAQMGSGAAFPDCIERL